MIRLAACGVLLAALAAGLAADEAAQDAGPAKAVDLFRQVRDAEKAKKSADVKARMAEFTAAVQAAAEHLPAVPVEETAKPMQYHSLKLNAGPARVDGFRFRVPAGTGGWDLAWEFVYPRGAGGFTWGLAAREGTVDGFKSFTVKDNYAETGADLPKENRRILQRLPGGKLMAGAGYVIWFAFADDRPVDLHIRLGVTPTKR